MAGSAGRRNILRELSSPGSNAFQSNIPSSSATTPTSPDESVIQHRGQQKKSATYKYNAPDPVFFKTPTKSPKKISIDHFLSPVKTAVRSSPRKRLLASPESLKEMPMECCSMEDLSISGKRAKKNIDEAKPTTKFEKGLKALSHTQLVNLICFTLKEVPEVGEVMKKLCPEPDLSTSTSRLYKLQRNVLKSVPRNVFGSQDGSYCYLRVRSHLEAFKEELFEVSNQLVESQLWSTALEYIIYSMKLTSELPNWDNITYNKIKLDCKNHLGLKFTVVFKNAEMNSTAISGVIKKLKAIRRRDQDLVACIMLAEQFFKDALA